MKKLIIGLVALQGLAAWAQQGVTYTPPSTPSVGVNHGCAKTSSGGLKCWGDNWYGQLGDGTTASTRIAVLPVKALAGANLYGVVSVASGSDYTCAVVNVPAVGIAPAIAGAVKCFGNNTLGIVTGKLGTGSVSGNVLYPTLVKTSSTTFLQGVSALSAGSKHVCALITNGATSGTVKCWGAGTNGQLGNGNANNSNTPVNVVDSANNLALAGVTSIASGAIHSCARLSNAKVKCWGNNVAGQLGDSTLIDRNKATEVTGGYTGVSVALGGFTSCAVNVAGAMHCWGKNDKGQLGQGNTTNQSTPVQVSGISVVKAAVGDGHVCALLGSGAISCWGDNSLGQLGSGNLINYTSPHASQITSGASNISAGSYNSCAVTGNAVKCWGLNASGQVGNQPPTSSANPVVVGGVTAINTAGTPVAEVGAGLEHSCARIADKVYCWGTNSYMSHQLGYDNINGNQAWASAAPKIVESNHQLSTPLSGVTKLSVGYEHSCVVASGKAVCWGNNSNSQINPGGAAVTVATVPTDSNTGIAVFPAAWTIKDIAVAGDDDTNQDPHYTCAIYDGGGVVGGVKCLGSADSTPAVPTISGVPITGAVEIAAGAGGACVRLSTTGQVYCWQDNGWSLGTTAGAFVTGLPAPASKIAVVGAQGCAIVNGGSLWCWSSNSGATAAVATQKISSGVVKVGLGRNHGCAVLTSGATQCWGNNNRGQLGIVGAPATASAPTATSFLSNVSSIAGGEEHTCAAVGANVYCTGNGDGLQLGIGNVTVPAAVIGL